MDKDLLLRIESKVDKLDSRLDSVDINQAEIKKDLKYHIKRTDLLEEKVKPIENHVAMVNGGLKLLGVISLILGIILSIIKLIK